MVSAETQKYLHRNPDFDDGRVVWSDDYSGLYRPTMYADQFDDQWRFFLERQRGFCNHTGVETSDPYIDDRIFELTGVKGLIERRKLGILYPVISVWRHALRTDRRRDVGGRLYLNPKFGLDYFKDKYCLDVGCGVGRWTRVLMELGGKVLSADVSEHAVRATSQFNKNVTKLDIFEIPQRKDLLAAFDFTLCWGVIMCTHDPKLAFESVASTVKPGGSLYVMVYAPTYHASDAVREMRRRFHRECRTSEEKLRFVFDVAQDPDNAINYLDMLNTFYNWTIPEQVVHDWYRASGFTNIITLNKDEPDPCAWHVFGQRRS